MDAAAFARSAASFRAVEQRRTSRTHVPALLFRGRARAAQGVEHARPGRRLSRVDLGSRARRRYEVGRAGPSNATEGGRSEARSHAAGLRFRPTATQDMALPRILLLSEREGSAPRHQARRRRRQLGAPRRRPSAAARPNRAALPGASGWRLRCDGGLWALMVSWTMTKSRKSRRNCLKTTAHSGGCEGTPDEP